MLTLVETTTEDLDNLFDDPNETSGLEDRIDWDEFEKMLDDGAFGTKQEVRAWVAVELDEPLNRWTWEAVKAGLFPEYRELYDGLPSNDPMLATGALLDWATVREIRSRHAAGEKVSPLARAYGIGRTTVSNVVNNITWKESNAA